jgi:hypothetical protein
MSAGIVRLEPPVPRMPYESSPTQYTLPSRIPHVEY